MTLPTDSQNPGEITDPSSRVRDGLRELEHYVAEEQIFCMEEEMYFGLLGTAYRTELNYLKTAYVAIPQSDQCLRTRSPSEYLFSRQYGEVDRTLTGLNALRWIYRNDYNSYTRNQPPETKLTRGTFKTIRNLFQRYTSTQEIMTLITMQMTNDLGKSSALQSLYYGNESDQNHNQVNHDMMMYFVIRNRPELVPSFQYLPSTEQKLVQDLLCVSAEFNPAQLMQAECPPEAMLILQEQDWNSDFMKQALDRKFLELILDLSGALGQTDHEGAKTMTEPVARSLLHALEVSKLVAGFEITLQEAYEQVLEHRLELLRKANWKKTLDIRNSHRDFTKARLLCMGRVDSAQKADFFDMVYDNLPDQIQKDLEWGMRIDHEITRQATYMPSMVAGCKTTEQLTVAFEYLARVLFISQSDLDTLPRDCDGGLIQGPVIVERDVLPIIKPLIKDERFQDRPSSLVNRDTPLPKLQVLKTSSNMQAQPVGDEYVRRR